MRRESSLSPSCDTLNRCTNYTDIDIYNLTRFLIHVFHLLSQLSRRYFYINKLLVDSVKSPKQTFDLCDSLNR